MTACLPLIPLLSVISHELRSPLASLKGTATLLVDYHDQLDMTQTVEFLAALDRETDRLTELLDDLVALARGQIGTLRLQRRRCSLGEILASVFEPACLWRSVPAQAEVLTVTVWADRRRLQRVLGYVVDLIQSTSAETVPGPCRAVEVSASNRSVILRWTDVDELLAIDHTARQLAQIENLDDPRLRRVAQPLLRWLLTQAIVELHDGQVWFETQSVPVRLCVGLPRAETEEVEWDACSGN